MHLTNRFAFAQMDSNQHRKLQEYIGSIIVKSTVETLNQNWNDEFKSRMESEFYENLNIAEGEYSESKELWSDGKPYTGNSVFSILAHNITEESGHSMNPVTIVMVLSIATNEFSKMKLVELIKAAAKVL